MACSVVVQISSYNAPYTANTSHDLRLTPLAFLECLGRGTSSTPQTLNTIQSAPCIQVRFFQNHNTTISFNQKKGIYFFLFISFMNGFSFNLPWWCSSQNRAFSGQNFIRFKLKNCISHNKCFHRNQIEICSK